MRKEEEKEGRHVFKGGRREWKCVGSLVGGKGENGREEGETGRQAGRQVVARTKEGEALHTYSQSQRRHRSLKSS